MTYKFIPKNPLKFNCDICHYYTSNKKDYAKHILTQKHKILTTDLQKSLKIPNNSTNNFACECGNVYKHRQSLFNHKKKCICINDVENNIEKLENDVPAKELVLVLLKQNKELQQSLIEMSKQTSIINNTITNSNNKTFNLQVFLNETCKDAMNISDFIESVKLQVSDLENVGKVGYIEGISNIIIKNLQALDVNKRPVHCADQKREVMYVKDEDIWEKEDENNKKLRKAIRMIAHKNICMFKEFREKYPDCQDYDSKKNDQYNKIVYESMGGKGDDDYNKNTKIIKKIAKVVGIDKSCLL